MDWYIDIFSYTTDQYNTTQHDAVGNDRNKLRVYKMQLAYTCKKVRLVCMHQVVDWQRVHCASVWRVLRSHTYHNSGALEICPDSWIEHPIPYLSMILWIFPGAPWQGGSREWGCRPVCPRDRICAKNRTSAAYVWHLSVCHDGITSPLNTWCLVPDTMAEFSIAAFNTPPLHVRTDPWPAIQSPIK